MLCFVFVAKPAWADQHFGCCWEVLAELSSLLFSTHTEAGRLAVSKWLGGVRLGSWPQLMKGISHTMWCSTVRSQEKEEEEGGICGYGACFPIVCAGTTLAWKVGGQLPADGEQWILLFVHMQLLLSILNCCSLNSQVFSSSFWFLLYWGAFPQHWTAAVAVGSMKFYL